MRRRRLLSGLAGLATAGLVGSAGCLESTDPPATGGTGGNETTSATTNGTDETTTNRTDGTTTGTDPIAVGESISGDGLTVTLETVATQESAVYMTAPDALGVEGQDTQYVYANVSVDTDGESVVPDATEFRLRVDDDTYDPHAPGMGSVFLDQGRVETYDSDDGTGWIAFELPEDLNPSQVDLIVEAHDVEGEWRLPGRVVEALATPAPAFTVETLQAPDTASPGDGIELLVTVRNRGDHEGTFVTTVDATGPAYGPLEQRAVAIPGGETRTFTVTTSGFNTEYADDGQTVRYGVDWLGGSRRIEVTVFHRDDTVGTAEGTATGTGADTTERTVTTADDPERTTVAATTRPESETATETPEPGE